MQTTAVMMQDYPVTIKPHKRRGVYWSAIIGGAIAATTISLLLLALGASLGFATVSPWYNAGASAKSFTLMAITWLVIMQWVSAGLGGYLTGRLRNQWHGFHADEGFFRDTVHGFLTWAISTLVVVVVVSSAASQTLRTGAAMAGAHEWMHGPNQMQDPDAGPFAYYVDKLYRPAGNAPDTANSRDVNGETARILMKNIGDSTVSEPDKAYLTRLVSNRTGLTPTDARARVTDVLDQEKADEMKMRAMADDARRAAARFALFTFVALLVGAFVASVAAALGGMHRDTYDALLTK